MTIKIAEYEEKIMRAMALSNPGGFDQLQLVDRSDPGAPGPNEVLVEIHATTVNYHDYLVIKGIIPVKDGLIPMSDGGGVVLAVGDAVTEFVPGDFVVSMFFQGWEDGTQQAGLGRMVSGDALDGFAVERVRAPAHAFTLAPRGYNHMEAASLTCAGLTAWRALMVEGNIKPGDRLLVQGTGGVSIFALQFAKAAGAIVIATSSSDAKLERLKSLGADHLINYRRTPDWGKAAREFAPGGVDHVVEVGGAGTLAQSIVAVRDGGHISLIGALAGFSGEVSTAELMIHQIRLIGLTVGNRRQQRDMVRAIEANDIRPVLDKTFDLADLASAFRYQETGAHFGKIAVAW